MLFSALFSSVCSGQTCFLWSRPGRDGITVGNTGLRHIPIIQSATIICCCAFWNTLEKGIYLQYSGIRRGWFTSTGSLIRRDTLIMCSPWMPTPSPGIRRRWGRTLPYMCCPLPSSPGSIFLMDSISNIIQRVLWAVTVHISIRGGELGRKCCSAQLWTADWDCISSTAIQSEGHLFIDILHGTACRYILLFPMQERHRYTRIILSIYT